MGYNTDFYGQFLIQPPLPEADRAELAYIVEQSQDGMIAGSPDGWCQWGIDEAGTTLEWDGGEKFYDYVEWLEFLLVQFFTPKGYTVIGEVIWQGEEYDDKGKIVLDDASNTVKLFSPNDSWTQVK